MGPSSQQHQAAEHGSFGHLALALESRIWERGYGVSPVTKGERWRQLCCRRVPHRGQERALCESEAWSLDYLGAYKRSKMPELWGPSWGELQTDCETSLRETSVSQPTKAKGKTSEECFDIGVETQSWPPPSVLSLALVQYFLAVLPSLPFETAKCILCHDTLDYVVYLSILQGITANWLS